MSGTGSYIITLLAIEAAATSLAAGIERWLVVGKVKVLVQSGTIRIEENGETVFHMKALRDDDALIIDYPRTANGQDGRGWAMLGVLLAMNYAKKKGCTKTYAGTLIEPTGEAAGFWGRCGLPGGPSTKSEIATVLAKVQEWLLSKTGTSTQITIRPRQVTVTPQTMIHVLRLKGG